MANYLRSFWKADSSNYC